MSGEVSTSTGPGSAAYVYAETSSQIILAVFTMSDVGHLVSDVSFSYHMYGIPWAQFFEGSSDGDSTRRCGLNLATLATVVFQGSASQYILDDQSMSICAFITQEAPRSQETWLWITSK